jgi:hypothetical protein
MEGGVLAACFGLKGVLSAHLSHDCFHRLRPFWSSIVSPSIHIRFCPSSNDGYPCVFNSAYLLAVYNMTCGTFVAFAAAW